MPTQELTNCDIVIGALTVWGEARGESATGRKAVAWVIRNRAEYAIEYKEKHDGKEYRLFGDGSIVSVCLVPWQFSCWNMRDPNREKMLGMLVDRSLVSPRFTPEAARDLVLGGCVSSLLAVMQEKPKDDITKGSTHYYDTRMPYVPAWAENKVPAAIIGHHAFFANIDHVDNPSYEWNAPYLDSSS